MVYTGKEQVAADNIQTSPKYRNPREMLQAQGIQSGTGNNYWRKIAEAAGFGGMVKPGWMKDPANATVVRLIQDIVNGHAKQGANGGWINERPDGYTSFDAQGNPTWNTGAVPAGTIGDQNKFMNAVSNSFGLNPTNILPPTPMAGLTPSIVNTAYTKPAPTKPTYKPPSSNPTDPPQLDLNPFAGNVDPYQQQIKPKMGNTGPLPPTTNNISSFMSNPTMQSGTLGMNTFSAGVKRKPFGSMFQ